MLLLLSSLVFSTLYYGLFVWSNTSKCNIKKLQLVQNFAARIILDLKKFYHISQGTKFLIWLPVSENFNERYCSDV